MSYMVQIIELFGRKANVAALAFFMENPTAEIHASGLAKKTGLSRNSTSGALSLLSRLGLAKPKKMGKAIFYSLNRGDPTVKALKRLLTISRLRQALVKEGVEGAEVYLFGSAARGEDTKRSDIDVLVIGGEGKRRDRQLFAALGGERIKIAFFTPMEFSMLARKDKPFYDAIERDKVRLL